MRGGNVPVDIHRYTLITGTFCFAYKVGNNKIIYSIEPHSRSINLKIFLTFKETTF